MQQVDPSATFLALDEIPFRRGSGFRFGDEELTANQPLPFGNPTNMSEQLKSVPGAGTTERQEEWTVKSLCVEFVDNEFKLSRRKKAWLVQSVERIIDDGWNCTLEEQFAEWAPDDFVMKFEMPRIFFQIKCLAAATGTNWPHISPIYSLLETKKVSGATSNEGKKCMMPLITQQFFEL